MANVNLARAIVEQDGQRVLVPFVSLPGTTPTPESVGALLAQGGHGTFVGFDPDVGTLSPEEQRSLAQQAAQQQLILRPPTDVDPTAPPTPPTPPTLGPTPPTPAVRAPAPQARGFQGSTALSRLPGLFGTVGGGVGLPMLLGSPGGPAGIAAATVGSMLGGGLLGGLGDPLAPREEQVGMLERGRREAIGGGGATLFGEAAMRGVLNPVARRTLKPLSDRGLTEARKLVALFDKHGIPPSLAGIMPFGGAERVGAIAGEGFKREFGESQLLPLTTRLWNLVKQPVVLDVGGQRGTATVGGRLEHAIPSLRRTVTGAPEIVRAQRALVAANRAQLAAREGSEAVRITQAGGRVAGGPSPADLPAAGQAARRETIRSGAEARAAKHALAEADAAFDAAFKGRTTKATVTKVKAALFSDPPQTAELIKLLRSDPTEFSTVVSVLPEVQPLAQQAFLTDALVESGKTGKNFIDPNKFLARLDTLKGNARFRLFPGDTGRAISELETVMRNMKEGLAVGAAASTEKLIDKRSIPWQVVAVGMIGVASALSSTNLSGDPNADAFDAVGFGSKALVGTTAALTILPFVARWALTNPTGIRWMTGVIDQTARGARITDVAPAAVMSGVQSLRQEIDRFGNLTNALSNVDVSAGNLPIVSPQLLPNIGRRRPIRDSLLTSPESQ